MRLLFIRHGDPDYAHDTLTEKGHREARLLAAAAPDLHLGTCYVSPLGRAQATADYCLKATGLTAQTMDWLREFQTDFNLNRSPHMSEAFTGVQVIDGVYQRCCFWDMLADYWTEDPIYMDPLRWRESPVARECNLTANYDHVCAEFDRLLAVHGYVREGAHYRVEKESDKTLTFFCHFGITSALISHLWNVSPFILWFQTQMAPTSVSELITQERTTGYAHFRAQRMGDISHLYVKKEEPSFAGRFCECYHNFNQRH